MFFPIIANEDPLPPSSPLTEFYPTGLVRMAKRDEALTHEKKFSSAGCLSHEFLFLELPEGEQIFHSPSFLYSDRGNLLEMTFFDQGELSEYPLGSLSSRISYIKDQKEDPCEKFFPSQSLKKYVNYCDGKLARNVVCYYRKGQKASEADYLPGVLYGLWRGYHGNGIAACQVHYKTLTRYFKAYSRQKFKIIRMTGG